ncbi:MAG: hypothetical protein ACYDA1_03655, partial [Vulcanimicrobiaceae bacterium]
RRARQHVPYATAIAEDILRNTELDEFSRETIELWLLAAVAAIPTWRNRASQLAATLLGRDVPNYRVIPWVQALELDADVSVAIGYLERLESDQKATADQIQVLAISLLSEKRGAECEALMTRNRSRFFPSQSAQWHYFSAEALVAQGKFQEAREEAASIDRAELQHRTLEGIDFEVQEAHGSADDDLSNLRPVELLDRLDGAARAKDWSIIDLYADRMFAAIPSLYVARLTILASYNAQAYGHTLELYDQFASLYGELIPELERARAYAMERKGDPRAIQVLLHLIEHHPTSENVLFAGQLFATRGDFSPIESLARKYGGDASGELSLAFAGWLQLKNREYARTLLLQSIERGVPPKHSA